MEESGAGVSVPGTVQEPRTSEDLTAKGPRRTKFQARIERLEFQAGYGKDNQKLRDSFSAVSRPNLASTHLFCSRFQDLPVLHTSGPLKAQHLIRTSSNIL